MAGLTIIRTLATLTSALTLITCEVTTPNCTFVREGERVVSADCSGRGWTSIPRDLIPSSVVYLNFSGNQLTSLPNGSFGDLQHLQTLDLSENPISKLDNGSFSGLHHLTWLSLHGNSLRMVPGTFPDGVFKDLARLTFLDLQMQPFFISADMVYPDVALSRLVQLKTLKMDGLGNNVELGSGFSRLWRLEELNMNDDTGHCALTELSEKFFSSLNTPRPLTLNLTHCKLRTIHNNTFSYLPSLHSLDLSKNRHLTFPCFMEGSKSLWRTGVQVLNITTIQKKDIIMLKAEYFQYLGYSRLRHLEVCDNRIYLIEPDAIQNLPTELEYLSVCDNKLIAADFLYGLYLKPHITTVQLSHQVRARQTHSSNNSVATVDSNNGIASVDSQVEPMSGPHPHRNLTPATVVSAAGQVEMTPGPRDHQGALLETGVTKPGVIKSDVIKPRVIKPHVTKSDVIRPIAYAARSEKTPAGSRAEASDDKIGRDTSLYFVPLVGKRGVTPGFPTFSGGPRSDAQRGGHAGGDEEISGQQKTYQQTTEQDASESQQFFLSERPAAGLHTTEPHTTNQVHSRADSSLSDDYDRSPTAEKITSLHTDQSSSHRNNLDDLSFDQKLQAKETLETSPKVDDLYNKGLYMNGESEYSEKRIPRSPGDSNVCLDPLLVKRDKIRVYTLLRGLKTFLYEHNVQIGEPRPMFKLHANQERKEKTEVSDSPYSGQRPPPPEPEQNFRRLTRKANHISEMGAPAKKKESPNLSDSTETFPNTTENFSSTAETFLNFTDDFVILPPTVRFVYGQDMKVTYTLPRFQFSVNRLEVLDLSHNNMPCFLGPWLGLHQLLHFDLSYNFAGYLSKDFFMDMPSLTHLFLQGNFLGDSFQNDSDGRILSGLPSLEVLDLSSNYIKHLSAMAFSANRKLIRLSLARNAITHFGPRFGNMSSLAFVDLSENNIAFLQHEMTDDFDAVSELSNLTIDLYKNPLSCGCDSLAFWYWVVGQTRVRLHRLEEYKCTLSNGSEISYSVLERELDSVWLQCQGQRLLNIAIGMLACLLLPLFVLGLLHHKRWRLRYFYYVGLRRNRRPYDHRQALNHRNPQQMRDVFISFDDEDILVRRFLQDVLKPELERRGMTFYISEIDFPNWFIKDIIPEVVMGARKTLTLFSSRFFPSYERELEFNMAVYHEAQTHRRVIVPVLWEHVNWSVFPPEVMVYLEENFVIPYQHGNEQFMDMLMNRINTEVRI